MPPRGASVSGGVGASRAMMQQIDFTPTLEQPATVQAAMAELLDVSFQ